MILQSGGLGCRLRDTAGHVVYAVATLGILASPCPGRLVLHRDRRRGPGLWFSPAWFWWPP